MSQPLSTSDSWQDCPPGELKRMLETIKIRGRRRALKQLGALGAAIAVSGIGGHAAITRTYFPRETRYGGLACREVMELLSNYRAKRLSDELSRKVTLHLRQCPDCGPRFRSAGGRISI